MDFYPTLLDVAGADPQASLDGVSLMPLLKGKAMLDRDAIYFHYPNYAWHRSNRLGSAVRSGRYKLIERFDDGSVELYDLTADLSERNNLATEMPARADKLRSMLTSWRDETGAAMPVMRRQ